VSKRMLFSRPSQICLHISLMTPSHDAMLHSEKNDPSTRQGQYSQAPVRASGEGAWLAAGCAAGPSIMGPKRRHQGA